MGGGGACILCSASLDCFSSTRLGLQEQTGCPGWVDRCEVHRLRSDWMSWDITVIL